MSPNRTEEIQEIEDRIEDRIIVDAYDEQERAMGWYYYLNDTIQFPFKAKCIAEKATSPLQLNQLTNVVGMANSDDCLHDMFVMIEWNNRKLAVPLSQLEGTSLDSESEQALGDWAYWVGHGYNF